MKPLGATLLAILCVGAWAGAGRAQEAERSIAEAAAAAACLPPPCFTVLDFPPCDDPLRQYHVRAVDVLGIAVADGPEVRPLGGALTGPPEMSVCVQIDRDTHQFYLPGIDEPVLRLGMLSLLGAAMQARAPVDIAFGMPNGALRKIEGLTFGQAATSGAEPAITVLQCGYGDFARCDTAYEVVSGAAPTRVTAKLTGMHLFGYGKGSRAAQIFTDNKTHPSFMIDPKATPERFLQLLNLAFTAQISGRALDISATAGAPPKPSEAGATAPPVALDITMAATP